MMFRPLIFIVDLSMNVRRGSTIYHALGVPRITQDLLTKNVHVTNSLD